jgi:hypothetical protein
MKWGSVSDQTHTKYQSASRHSDDKV